MAPALLLVAGTWIWQAWRHEPPVDARVDGTADAGGVNAPLRAWRAQLRRTLVRCVLLAAGTAVLMLPMWLELKAFLGGDSSLFASGSGSGTSSGTASAAAQGLGNLYRPLSAFQLGGVWPVATSACGHRRTSPRRCS